MGNPSLSSYQDYRFRGLNLLLLRESFEPRTRVVWGGHSSPPLSTYRVARVPVLNTVEGPVLSAVEGMGHLSWDGAKGGPARPTAHGIRTQGLDVRELTLLAKGVKYFLLTSPFIEPAGRTLLQDA